MFFCWVDFEIGANDFYNINCLGVRNGDNTGLNSLHLSAVRQANIMDTHSDVSLGSLESDNSSVISYNNNVTSPHRILLTSTKTKEKQIKKYVNYLQWIIVYCVSFYNGLFDGLIDFLSVLFVLILIFFIMAIQSLKLLLIETFYFEELKLFNIVEDGDKYNYYYHYYN